jgi:hypothetical protein
MSSNNKLRSNLESIEKDVSNLLEKINTPNDKLFNRSIDSSIQINGYVDRADLYRNNLNSSSSKMKNNIQMMEEQNKQIDNRLELYPNSEVKEYKDLRKAVISNNDGTPFKNASIRDKTLPYDTLLTKNEKEMLKNRLTNKEGKDNSSENSMENVKKDPKDNRFNLYPNSEINEYGQKRNETVKNPSNGQPFENAYQRKNATTREINKETNTENFKNSTGDVFTHANDRDRVPVNPREGYRSAYYQSTDKNQLDQEVTFDKNRRQILEGQLNYPNGDVFTHGNQRDRVPIDPLNVYRSSDYVSNQYNQLDIDVEHIPQKAMINKTVDNMLHREFDINNDNRTTKEEYNETSMIHTPYTPLDKFGKSDVRFKNINESKPQVDILNEYIFNIDSADRNTTYYPNPFKIRILFNPTDDSNLSGANPDLKIARAFENIKYLRLETATFPRYYSLKYTSAISSTPTFGDSNEQTILTDVIAKIAEKDIYSNFDFQAYINSTPSTANSYNPPINYITQYVSYTWISSSNINAKFNIVNPSNISIAYEMVYTGIAANTVTNRYIVDTNKDLSKDRYLMLNIDEITDNTQNSTSGKNQYNYLYPDYITDNYFYGDNHFVDKIFKNAKLGMIKNLTITISDSFGNLLNGGKYIDSLSSTTDNKSTTDTQTPTTVYNDSVSYIRHPYYRNFQLTLMFKVGCYETEIDKKIFY